MREAARKDVEESFTETEMIHRTQRMYLDLIREFLAALLRGKNKERVGLEGETTCPLPL